MSLQIQSNVSLQSRSGMATPAITKALVEVKEIEQLKAALAFANQQHLPPLMLGEGSNTVFIEDYLGLVIINQLQGVSIKEEGEDYLVLEVAAGENWHQFVEYCLSQHWFGLENLALIPGSVGAAPMQNIGAYGVEVEQFIESVHYLDTQTHRKVSLDRESCEFSYRDSVFKHTLAGRAMITSVRFRLSKTPKLDLSYVALRNRLKLETATPRDVFDAVCEIRSAKLPLPADVPNCGSFFKNPVVTAKKRAELLIQHPDLVSFPFQQRYKLAAAWLIEKLGWKQRDFQGVTVHDSQSLVITNPRGADGRAVHEYAMRIQKDVQRAYDIQLEVEPQII